MPRVSRRTGPEVPLDPLSQQNFTADAPLEAFGGGAAARPFEVAGRILGDVQRAAFERMSEEEELADHARGLELRRAFNAWESEHLEAALATRGRDALGVEKPLKDNFRKFAAEQESRLHGENQKAIFRKGVIDREEYISRRITDHIAAQSKIIEVGEYQATIESSKERAMRDPSTSSLELVVLMDSTLERGRALGLGPAAIDQELQKETSDFHARVADAMLARGQDLDANAYYQKNNLSQVLDPDVDVELRKALKRGTDRSEARREVDVLLGYAPKPTPSGDAVFNRRPTESEAYEQARKIKNDDVRALAEQLIEHDYARQRRLDEEQYRARMEQAADVIGKTKSPAAVPPGIWADLKFKDQAALTRYARQAASGVEPETDWAEWTRLRLLTPPELSTFTEARLATEVRPYLDNTEYEQFVERVADARKGGEKYQSEFTNDEIRLQALQDTGLGGIKPSDTLSTIASSKEPDKAAMFGMFKKAVDTQLAAYHETNKKNADDKERRRIIESTALLWSQKLTVKHPGFAALPVYEERTLASLIAPEARGVLKTSQIVIPEKLRTQFFHVARSKAGLLPVGMTQERFEYDHRDRLNRAYLAALAGADDQRIEAIIAGSD